MIQQFKSINFLNIFLLFAFTYILRIGLFLDLPQMINTGFSELGTRLLLADNQYSYLSPGLNVFLAGLVIFTQALLFNRLISEYNILSRPTFLPALMYIVLSSVFTPFLFLSPPLIGNFFILFIFFKILDSYKKTDLISTMFDLGLITALATVIYFPFVFFVIALWVALLIFRGFNWREWVAVILGYLVIVTFLGVYYFWNNSIGYFFEIWKPLTEGFPIFIKIQPADYIVLLPIAIGLILGALRLRENFYRSYIQMRKTFIFLFYLFLTVVLSFYLKPDYRINHFLLGVIPIALLLAYYFLNAAKRWFYEPLFVIIVGFIIYFQFV